MPQTIQDAFRICRELEFWYLRVDAICIIQVSKADWHSEASKMGWIYRNSRLTISADLSDNVELGCFNNRSLPQTEDLEALVRITHRLEDGQSSSLFHLPTVSRLSNKYLKRLTTIGNRLDFPRTRIVTTNFALHELPADLGVS